MSDKVYIYGLIDPRDRMIKYVGQTVDMRRRLKQHIDDRKATPKCRWIAELRHADLEPEMILLETVAEDSAHAVENWWILFCRHQGWPNVNGTNPGEWRADFGEMFSEDLERQYERFVARLESAEREHEMVSNQKMFNRWVARFSFYLFNTAFYICLLSVPDVNTEDTAFMAIVLMALGVVKVFVLEKMCRPMFDELERSVQEVRSTYSDIKLIFKNGITNARKRWDEREMV